MSVSHITLLNYLGKHIVFKVPVPIEYDHSGFEQLSGQVIAVIVDLSQKHALCVQYDESTGSADNFLFDEMIFI